MKLYKTNSVDDAGYELTAEEIADRFRGSEQHGYWHQGWPLDRALRVFITYELGGWAADAEDDYYEVFDLVREQDRKTS